jgi:transposase
MYNIEIRKLAIERMCSGVEKEDISKCLGMSLRTLSEWNARVKRGIGLKPLIYGPKKGKLDLALLRDYVEKYPDAYLSEIGAHFNVSGEAIRKRLKKISISRKKKPLNTANAAKKKDLNLKKN